MKGSIKWLLLKGSTSFDMAFCSGCQDAVEILTLWMLMTVILKIINFQAGGYGLSGRVPA
jgi:hypothetical protein